MNVHWAARALAARLHSPEVLHSGHVRVPVLVGPQAKTVGIIAGALSLMESGEALRPSRVSAADLTRRSRVCPEAGQLLIYSDFLFTRPGAAPCAEQRESTLLCALLGQRLPEDPPCAGRVVVTAEHLELRSAETTWLMRRLSFLHVLAPTPEASAQLDLRLAEAGHLPNLSSKTPS